MKYFILALSITVFSSCASQVKLRDPAQADIGTIKTLDQDPQMKLFTSKIKSIDVMLKLMYVTFENGTFVNIHNDYPTLQQIAISAFSNNKTVQYQIHSLPKGNNSVTTISRITVLQ